MRFLSKKQTVTAFLKLFKRAKRRKIGVHTSLMRDHRSKILKSALFLKPLLDSFVNKFRQSFNAWQVNFFAAPVHMGLNFTHAGDTTEVVAYVSPNKARFFTLSAEHFFGVGDIFIDVRTVFFVLWHC